MGKLWLFRFLGVLFCNLVLNSVIGQIPDSIRTKVSGITATPLKTILPDSALKVPSVLKVDPKLATRRSAMVPGWGQIYIKQNWFVPVIYVGFGACAYFINYNGVRHKAFSSAYIQAREQKLERNQVIINGQTGEYSTENLKQYSNYFLRYKQLSWFAIPLVWGVNVLDANVAAHLKSFDMSDDISLKVQPSVLPANNMYALGMRVNIQFK
jgi:hypothetical protein